LRVEAQLQLDEEEAFEKATSRIFFLHVKLAIFFFFFKREDKISKLTRQPFDPFHSIVAGGLAAARSAAIPTGLGKQSKHERRRYSPDR
jgi:hypothetical protein